MKIDIQIICFIISFLYGIFIEKIICYHDSLKLPYIPKIFIYILYSFLLVILYVDIIYFINGGIFHIYFGILMLVGYFISKKYLSKKIKSKRKFHF